MPERTHLLEDVAGHAPALLPLGIVRHHLLLDEVAGQLAERFVVFGEQVSAHGSPCLGDEFDQRGVGGAAALAHGLQSVANSVVAHVM